MALPKISDPHEVTVKRARKLYYLLWAGIVWSLIFTSVAIVIMVNLASSLSSTKDRLLDSCESRQAARTALRTVIQNDPDTSADDLALLDVNLPVRVSC